MQIPLLFRFLEKIQTLKFKCEYGCRIPKREQFGHKREDTNDACHSALLP